MELLDILEKDNPGWFKVFLKKYPWWLKNNLTIQLDSEPLNPEQKYYYLSEIVVSKGALRCLRYLDQADPVNDHSNLENYAIETRQPAILEYLLRDESQESLSYLLERAYASRDKSMIRSVLARIQHLEKTFLFNGTTVFDHAFLTLDPEIVKMTIRSYKNKQSVQKAFDWVEAGDLQKIKKNVTSNNVTNFQLTPSCGLVEWATFLGRTDILAYLLSIGADPGRDGYYLGSQPVYLAVLMKRTDCLRLLVDAGAALSLYHVTWIPPDEPFSIVDYCYLNLGREEAIHLLKKGAEITMELLGVGLYSHLLNIAVGRDDREMVEYLLTRYEPEYAKCVIPLEFAVKNGHSEYIDLWIKYGYNFTQYQDLMEYAFQYDNYPVYQQLLKLNKAYDTKLDLYLAVKNNATNILAHLPKPKGYAGKKVRLEDSYMDDDYKTVTRYAETTLLETALAYGSLPCAEYLLREGADPHALNQKGESLLYLCLDSPEKTRLLLKYKAKVNQLLVIKGDNSDYSSYDDDSDRRTILDFTRNYETFSILRQAGALYSWELDSTQK